MAHLGAEEFIKYGPLKPDNEQGYTEEQLEKFSSPDTELPDKPRNEIYKNGFMFYDNPDPSGRRVGQGNVNDTHSLFGCMFENAIGYIVILNYWV